MEHQYAQIATEIHAAEVMTYNACRMKENGIPFVKEASMVKLYASQVAEKAASKSIEVSSFMQLQCSLIDSSG